MKKGISILAIDFPVTEDSTYYRCDKGHLSRVIGIDVKVNKLERRYCVVCLVAWLDTFLSDIEEIDPCEDLSPAEMNEL